MVISTHHHSQNQKTTTNIVPILIYTICLILFVNIYTYGKTNALNSKQRIDALIAKGKTETDYSKANNYLQQALLAIKQTDTLKKYDKQFLLATTWQTIGRITQKAYKKDRKNHLLRTKSYRYQRKAIDIFLHINQSTRYNANRLDKIMGASADGIVKFVPQSQYAIAWAYHDLAEIAPSKQESLTNYQSAIEAFKYFTDKDYYNHPIIANAFLGHGICLYALNQYASSLALISPLSSENTPRDVYDKLILLKINIYKAVDDMEKGLKTLKTYFNAQTDNAPFNQFQTHLLLEWTRIVVSFETSRNVDLTPNIKTIEQYLDRIKTPYKDAFYRIASTREIDSPGFFLNNIKISFTNKLYPETLKHINNALENYEINDHLIKEFKYRQILCQWYLNQYLFAFDNGIYFINKYKKDNRREEISIIVIEAGYQAYKATRKPDETELNNAYDQLLTQNITDSNETQISLKKGWIALDGEKYFKAKSILTNISEIDPLFGQAIYGIIYCVSQSQYSFKELNKYFQLLETWYSHHHNEKDIYFKSLGLIVQLIHKSSVTTNNTEIVNQIITTLRTDSDLDPKILKQIKEIQIQTNLLSKECEASLANIVQYCHQYHADHLGAIFIYNLIEKMNNHFKAVNSCDDIKTETILTIYQSLFKYISYNPTSEISKKDTVLRIHYYNILYDNQRYPDCIDAINKDLLNHNNTHTTPLLTLLAKSYEKKLLWAQASGIWHKLIHHLAKHQTTWYQAHYNQISSMYKSGDLNNAKNLLHNFKVRYNQIKEQHWQQKFSGLEAKLKQPCKP